MQNLAQHPAVCLMWSEHFTTGVRLENELLHAYLSFVNNRSCDILGDNLALCALINLACTLHMSHSYVLMKNYHLEEVHRVS